MDCHFLVEGNYFVLYPKFRVLMKVNETLKIKSIKKLKKRVIFIK